MTLKYVYLTIDDSPSIHMSTKVDFLKKRNIPALFYVRGEFIEEHFDQVVYASTQGFLIGNHSYSHPHFSNIEIDACFDEITQTEELIDACYKKASVVRPCKVVRLPFADRGGEQKDVKIQEFLRNSGFVPVLFDYLRDAYIDSSWDWDTKDYKSRFIQDLCAYRKQLEEFYDAYQKESAVILLHDFDTNHHLFEETMKFLLSKKVEFLTYKT